MTTLFENTTLNNIPLHNRMVRSATWEGMCEHDGRPTERLIDYYRTLAQGGVGLIISGYTFVLPEGKHLPKKMGITTDAFAADFKKLTDVVHQAGGTIAIQLVHAGGQTDTATIGRQPVAPSAVKVDQYPETPAELSKQDIADIVRAFGDASRRSKAWGFDAVQLHGAHGYLINQFLSPHTNLRTDEYGGAISGRCRFMLDVYDEVRATVGADYPVFIKLNATDFLDNGLTPDEGCYAARRLSDAGIDAIEVSGGTGASGRRNSVRLKINAPDKEAYHLDLACRIKETVSCPVMVVGGFRSYEIAEKAIAEHGMDYIALSRPLIREPHLPSRWEQGDRTPAKCISCNRCFKPGVEEGGIYCVIEKKEREKAQKNSKHP